MGRWPASWPESVHLIGVGGVAMSGLARLLSSRGVRVQGSDQAVYPPSSQMLASAGIETRTPFAPENLQPHPNLVVVGNAISRGNVELEYALDEGLPLASMPEIIERLLVPGKRVTAIAGTHGKTTTASLAAWLHHAAGRDPSFMIGAQPGNFPFGAASGDGEDLILEADEYDSAFFDKGPKFLHYWPQVAVLGNVEFDHADIYANLDEVKTAFSLLLRLVPPSGTLIVGADSPHAMELAQQARCRVLTFGREPGNDLGLIGREEGRQHQLVTYSLSGARGGQFRLSMPGEYNALNALAALLAFQAAGGDLKAGAESLREFRGPRRRLEVIYRDETITAFDDFAHHPSAVAGTLETLCALRPAGGRIIACIEPRSNTMVRARVQQELESALARADVVWVGPVNRPERFAADERLDVERLVKSLRARGLRAQGPLEADAIGREVLADLRSGDQIVIMSNGGFGGLPQLLATGLADRS